MRKRDPSLNASKMHTQSETITHPIIRSKYPKKKKKEQKKNQGKTNLNSCDHLMLGFTEKKPMNKIDRKNSQMVQKLLE